METKTVLKDVAEGWIAEKLVKGASRFFAPFAVLGLGRFVYQKWNARNAG